MKIDIIKHQSESDGKSTCPHAVVLAPDDVTVYTYPCIPDYDREKVTPPWVPVRVSMSVAGRMFLSAGGKHNLRKH